MPEVVGKSRPAATISAKVFDKDGNLLVDLGTIAGGNLTKEEEKKLKEQLKKLKKGEQNGGRRS